MKNSYGIACLRHNGRGYEILLIKRTYTYALSQFLLTPNGPKRVDKITKLLNNMVPEELRMLNRMNFNEIISHLYSDQSISASKFKYFRKNFEQWASNEKLLRSLLTHATPRGELWEIPKGRAILGETPLQTAMREFYEETGVTPDKIELLSPKVFTFTRFDCGVNYALHYFIATPLKEFDVRVNYVTDQWKEVMDVRWMSVPHLRNRFHTFLLNIAQTLIKITQKNFDLYYRIKARPDVDTAPEDIVKD